MALFLALGISMGWGQSSNQRGAISKLDASVLQTRSERGQAVGYVPLGEYVTPVGSPPALQLLINPQYMLPGFNAAADSTIWVKAGTTLAPLAGISSAGNGWTSNNVFIGALTTGVYGVKVGTGSTALYLRGGSGNQVAIDYGNTLGGSNAGRTDLLWFIGPSGGFKFASGEFNGATDFKGFAQNNVLTVGGANATLSLTAPSLVVSAGNFTFTLPTNQGVIIPSTGDAAHPTFALNTTAANLLYARLGSDNTLTGINTFTAAPVVPNASFTIAKTSGLQTALDAALKKDGSVTPTANITLGGFKLTNVGNPSSAQDAVTLAYLQANYDDTPVNSISIAGGTPITPSGSTGNVTLSMAAASSSVDGYLSHANWATFNAKQAPITASLPLALSGTSLSINQASAVANGFLAAVDYVTFASKENTLTFNAPLVRATNTISLPKATAVVSGYLDSADFANFQNGASFIGYGNGDLPIGNATLNGGTGGVTKAKITSTGGTITVTNGPGSINLEVPAPSGYTDGQFLIGSTAGGNVAKAVITGGTGITVTNFSHGIQITATGTAVGSDVYSIKTTTTTFTNDAAEETYHTYAMAANAMAAGKMMRIKVKGRYTYTATSQAFTIFFKIGSTIITSLAMPTSTGAESDQPFEAETTMTCRTGGTNASIFGFQKNTSFASGGKMAAGSFSVTGVNVTISNNVVVTAQMDSAVSLRAVNVDQLSITID